MFPKHPLKRECLGNAASSDFEFRCKAKWLSDSSVLDESVAGPNLITLRYRLSTSLSSRTRSLFNA